jgi:putative DNA methylase
LVSQQEVVSLMDFCYAWLRRLVGQEAEGFDRASTRSPDELTGNTTQSRGYEHFTDGLAAVYTAMARALKPGAPLAFTFHHNRIEAYHAIGVAILDSGLTCTATLPCPAEMGGSIHIYGTGSSILDTVFVCRAEAQAQPGRRFEDLDGLADIMARRTGPVAGCWHETHRRRYPLYGVWTPDPHGHPAVA